jgi:GTP-binding protein HflX
MGRRKWAAGSGRAIVLHPYARGADRRRDPHARLEEACGLAMAIGLDVVHADAFLLANPKPGSLLGRGRVEEVARFVGDKDIEVIIVDGVLTPVQQRNLEREWTCKVVDRTGLILEIFAERARTREGRLQVELAQLTYQRSRLVRSWTHLERQRGGLGTVGGPGETQIEADRRMIDERVVKLKQELQSVVRTRELHRKRRRDAPYPVIALVGYTNAGKSTLFNQLSGSKVTAQDQLFATLDPTMRGITLASGRKVVLSDTVGFISDLPTQLVAAFRATLEEVLEADILLHVRDISHVDSDAQKTDVEAVLAELGVDAAVAHNIIEVYNKIDLLSPQDLETKRNLAELADCDTVLVSAAVGTGTDTLLAAIDDKLSRRRETLVVDIDVADGAAVAWLYRRGQVLERKDSGETVRVTVSLDPEDASRLRQRKGVQVRESVTEFSVAAE